MLDHIARGLVTACTRFDFNVLSDLPIAGEVRSTAAAEGVMAAASNRIHTFLVLKQPGQSDRIIVWDTQEISLGRSPENDISVDHAEISRQHANFVRTGKSCVVQNLNTSNGTLVNGQPVTTHTLQARDAICIAEVELTFYQSAKDPVALGMPISYASQLKQFEGPSMGSGSACSIPSPDPTRNSRSSPPTISTCAGWPQPPPTLPPRAIWTSSSRDSVSTISTSPMRCCRGRSSPRRAPPRRRSSARSGS
jgi:pSer/pThr/pTyr-binding forkhead associated (FHA) protein